MEPQNKALKLASVKIFSDLKTAELHEIASMVHLRRFGAQDPVIRADEPSREVYFVLEGRVRVRRFMIDGREIIFSDLFEGSTFGEYAALDQAYRSTDAFAVEPSLLAVMQDSVFRDVLLRYPAACLKLATGFAQTIRISLRRIVDLSSMTANQRVCREILEMAETTSNTSFSVYDRPTVPHSIELNNVPSQAVIAGRIATSRETVSRVFSQLEQMGIIKRLNRTSFLIKDVSYLRRVVGGEETFEA